MSRFPSNTRLEAEPSVFAIGIAQIECSALVAELNLSDYARRIRERRVQTVALEIHELAIAVAVLVHSVETINTLTA